MPDGKPVLCHKCRFPYVGVSKVHVEQGTTQTTITNETTTTTPMKGDHGNRGSTVTLTFVCEYGHVFYKSISFYKGETTEENWANPNEFDASNTPSKLWRD